MYSKSIYIHIWISNSHTGTYELAGSLMHIKNLLFNKLAAPAGDISIASSSTDEPTTALNVSILAKELGYKCSDGQLQRIGRDMAKKYRETHQSNPSKHKQFVGGNFIPVNSYMERDRALMEQVIRTVMSQPVK